MSIRVASAIAAASMSLASCALPVSERDISWRYPALSKEQCPDLSGSYYEGIPVPVVDGCPHSWCSNKLYPTGLYALMTGGRSAPTMPGASFEEIRPLPTSSMATSKPTYVSRIRQSSDSIRVELRDIGGLTYVVGTVSMDGLRIGCSDGFLIIRKVRNHASAESGTPGVSYSETRIQKMTDSSLRAETWSAYRVRSSLGGRISGSEKDLTHRVWTFPLMVGTK